MLEQPNQLKKETVKSPEGGEVSFCPERGGIITSIKIRDKEILYMDDATFKNKDVSVKGGIPILFPNAGPVESEKFPGLKQHGFARDSSKWKSVKNENGFTETLISYNEKNAGYPYNLKLSMEGQFENNGSFTISQNVENLEADLEIPISMGLHPYFKVDKEERKNIKFNFDGGKEIEEKYEIWSNGKAVSIDNPKLKDPNAVLEVTIPNLGNLIIDPSLEYQKIWVWSMPDKDFVCVEPVMRDKNGIVDDPEMIKPKETFNANVNFDLK